MYGAIYARPPHVFTELYLYTKTTTMHLRHYTVTWTRRRWFKNNSVNFV